LSRKNSYFISSACAEKEVEEAYIANTITIPKTLTLFQVAEKKVEESYTANTIAIVSIAIAKNKNKNKKQQQKNNSLFVSNACKKMFAIAWRDSRYL